MSLHAPPHPHRLLSSRAIAPSEALALLSAYLAATATDASLHPNALLTESGPQSATTGSHTGLVLHNLKRVEAGLRGEHLDATFELDEFGGEGGEGGVNEWSGNGDATASTIPGPGTTRAVDLEGQGGDARMGQDGWQDKEEFEREQEDTVGEVGPRIGATVLDERVGDVTSSSKIENLPTAVEKVVDSDRKARKKLDKAERKAKKKEKRKQEKRDKEQRKRNTQARDI